MTYVSGKSLRRQKIAKRVAERWEDYRNWRFQAYKLDWNPISYLQWHHEHMRKWASQGDL